MRRSGGAGKGRGHDISGTAWVGNMSIENLAVTSLYEQHAWEHQGAMDTWHGVGGDIGYRDLGVWRLLHCCGF